MVAFKQTFQNEKAKAPLKECPRDVAERCIDECGGDTKHAFIKFIKHYHPSESNDSIKADAEKAAQYVIDNIEKWFPASIDFADVMTVAFGLSLGLSAFGMALSPPKPVYSSCNSATSVVKNGQVMILVSQHKQGRWPDMAVLLSHDKAKAVDQAEMLIRRDYDLDPVRGAWRYITKVIDLKACLVAEVG